MKYKVKIICKLYYNVANYMPEPSELLMLEQISQATIFTTTNCLLSHRTLWTIKKDVHLYRNTENILI